MSHFTPRVDLTFTLVSERTSASHFVPLCLENAHRSEANQAETAVRPTMLHAENTVVRVQVTWCWPDEYANSTRPMEKQATDNTRKASGDLLIQISTHHGTLCPGDRLRTVQLRYLGGKQNCTYYIACFQVTPSRLLTAAPILKTREVNQNELTALARVLSVISKENCIVVAVTALKNVATVLRFNKF